MKLIQKPLIIVPAFLGLATLIPTALGAVTLQEGAAQAEPAVALPEAREIVDRYLQVTGIDKFAPKYKSQKITGTIELVGMGIKGTTETISMKSGYTLSTVELAMVGTVLTGDNGKVAWMVHPAVGEHLLEGAELTQQRNRNAPFEFPLKKADRFEVMETVAKEEFDKRVCYKLRFVEKPYKNVDEDPEKTKRIREFFEYYEVETGLMAGMTMVATSSLQGDIPTTITMSDYKEFGEVMQPAKVMANQAGMQILAETKSIVFNEVEDVSIFDLPPAIKLLAEEKAKKTTGEVPDDGK